MSVVGQDAESLGLDEGDTVPRKQVMEHLGVLPGDCRPKHGQHAGRQAQADGEGVDVAGASSRAGAQDHLAPPQIGDDLIQERVNGGAAPVDQALPTDLDHVGPRQNRVVGRRLGRLENRLLIERTVQQRVPECRQGCLALSASHGPLELDNKLNLELVGMIVPREQPTDAPVWLGLRNSSFRG
jgi:hypothetical protein